MQKKTAQALKGKHKLRRLFNPTGKALATLNPAFRKLIKNLDKTDKRVRKEAEDLNYYIGMARSFIRRKDYLTAATYLTKFHEKIKLIHHQLNEFDGDISKDNRKFLLKQFKAKDKKHLFDYDPNKKIDKIKLVDDGLVSTAGTLKDWWRTPGRFSDLIHNLTDKKSKSMRALERNFSVPFFTQLKNDTKEMFASADQLYKDLLESFHRMGTAWSTRDVGSYIVEIKQINDLYNPYHEQFVKYYENNIVPMKKEQELIDSENQINKEPSPQDNKSNLQEGAFTAEKDPFPMQNLPEGAGAPEAVISEKPSSSLIFDLINQKHSAPQSSEEEPLTIKQPVQNPKVEQDSVPPTQRSPRTTNTVPSLAPPTPIPPPSVLWRKPSPMTQKYPYYNQPPVSNIPFSFNSPPGRKHEEDLSGLMSYDPDLKAKNDALKGEANLNFINRIEKLSTEHEIIKEILAYSEEVEKYSEEESLQLLAVAEGLIEKTSGAFDKIKKKLNIGNKPAPLQESKSESPPSLDPPTEDISHRGTATQKSPSTLDTSAPKLQEQKKEPKDLLDQLLYRKQLNPINHGIPMGNIQKRWSDMPFLSKINPSEIRISPNTSGVVIKKIVKYLYHKLLPSTQIADYQDKLIEAIKHSITKGQLVSNMLCSDAHNGRDCQLSVFCYVRLDQIDPSPSFNGIVLSFTATCRLSVFDGDITIKNISDPKLHNVSQ